MTLAKDGYGPKVGAPALGSALLDHWSDDKWQVPPGEDGGSVLRVELIKERHQSTPPG